MGDVTDFPGTDIDVYNLYELADVILKDAARIYRSSPEVLLDIRLDVLKALAEQDEESLKTE